MTIFFMLLLLTKLQQFYLATLSSVDKLLSMEKNVGAMHFPDYINNHESRFSYLGLLTNNAQCKCLW